MSLRIYVVTTLVFFLIPLSLSRAPPGYVKKPNRDKNPPKYEYGYDVKDGKGGRQGHLESRDGEYALGMYYVNLPGGTRQDVMYFADDWGYHPLVSYSSSSAHSSSKAQFALGERPVAALKQQALSSARATPAVNAVVQPSATVLQPVAPAAVPIIAQPATIVNVQTPVALAQPVPQAAFLRAGVVVSSNQAQSVSATSDYRPAGAILVGTLSPVPNQASSSSYQTYSQTSSSQYAGEQASPANSNIQYVSYVADTNKAVPLTVKVSQASQQEPASVNEVQNEVIVSSTPAPTSYSTLKPIVVTDFQEEQNRVEIVTPPPKVAVSSPTTQRTPVYIAPSRISSYFSSSTSESISVTTPQPISSTSPTSVPILSPTASSVIISHNGQQPVAAALTGSANLLAPLKAAESLGSDSQTSTFLNQPIVVPENEQVTTITSRPQAFVEVQKAIPIEIDENNEYGNSVGKLAVEINKIIDGYRQENAESLSKENSREELYLNSAQAILLGNPQRVLVSNGHISEEENEVVNVRGGKKLTSPEYPQDQQSEGGEAESEYAIQDTDGLEYNQQFFESVKQVNLGQYLTEGVQQHVSDVHSDDEVEKPEHLIHPVPVEKTNYVEYAQPVAVENPVHIIQQVPVEHTRLVEVEKPVPVIQQFPVEHTKVVTVEKPVPVIQPVHVEHTKFVEVEKPVPVIQQQTQYVEVERPVQVENTQLVAVDRPVPVPHPYPVEVTRIIPVDRPVPFPHPVPVPYAVPQPVRVPVHHILPYAHLVPVKSYRPTYTPIKLKAIKSPTFHKDIITNLKSYVHYGARYGDRIPIRTQHESGKSPRYHSTANRGRALGHSHRYNRVNHNIKNPCIEYGGFKPPLIPSTPYDSDAEVESEVAIKE